jgi:hypothetical protein
MDLGDRSDGPLIEFIPLDPDDGEDFAVCNTYGPYLRNLLYEDIIFQYEFGNNNIRNVTGNVGGEVLSHATILTQDNHWRVLTTWSDGAAEYGMWVLWEQADSTLDKNSSESDVRTGLGAIGAAILDEHGVPLNSLGIVLRRDDQMQDNANQFYWIDDFKVGDVVRIEASKGHEFFYGNYLIDEVRLEQESDGTGQVRQAMDVIPFVSMFDRDYTYLTDDLDKDPSS